MCAALVGRNLGYGYQRVSSPKRSFGRVAERHQPVRIGKRKRPEQHAFHNRENRSCRSNVAILVLMFVAMVSYLLYRMLCMGSLARRVGIANRGISSNLGWFCVFTFMANFALAMLYYGYVYSPQGTSKPDWLNNLPRKVV